MSFCDHFEEGSKNIEAASASFAPPRGDRGRGDLLGAAGLAAKPEGPSTQMWLFLYIRESFDKGS